MSQNAIHAFTFKDLHLVYDGVSQTLLTVDEVGLEVATLFKKMTRQRLVAELSSHFPRDVVEHAYDEIAGLVTEGALFCDEEQLFITPQSSNLRPPLALSGMCLNVAHDCNMRCSYCFAGTGRYGGRRSLMDGSSARSALDFLFQRAGGRAHLYVDFFGGEPLMNWDVIQDSIAYGNQLASSSGRTITWSLTTNGILLDDKVNDFLNSERVNVIISIDGRPHIHNQMRRDTRSKGTYETVLNRAKRLYESRYPEMTHRYGEGVYTYIRGTYTRHNLDFFQDIVHLYQEGFRHIAMEPVVSDASASWVIQNEDLNVLTQQYELLVEFVLESRRRKDPLYFHHFDIDLRRGPCLGKRLSGCGAGVHYLAVSPEGDIYPCHQFVGQTEFRMGDVFTGELNSDLTHTFEHVNFDMNPVCRTCFARYQCGGGCHANHWLIHHTLLYPDDFSCQLIKKRLECALYLEATEGM